MAGAWSSESEKLANLRSRVLEYNIDPDEPRAPKNYVDLGHLAALVAKTTLDAISAYADDVRSSRQIKGGIPLA